MIKTEKDWWDERSEVVVQC